MSESAAPRRPLLRVAVLLLCLAGAGFCASRWTGGLFFKSSIPNATSAGAEAPAPLTPLPPLSPPPEPLAVVIDAGHGGEDGGTVGNGLVEKEWTLKVALALADTLRGRGHSVELLRRDDTGISLMNRPPLVNQKPRLALLSIHFNAGASGAHGAETFYSWPKKPEVMARLHAAAEAVAREEPEDEGQALAAAIQEHIVTATGSRDRGLKNRQNLAMTSRSVCPAVLIECGFLTSGAESRRVRDDAWRQKLVSGIADGFEAWLRRRGEKPLKDFAPLDPLISLPATGEESLEH